MSKNTGIKMVVEFSAGHFGYNSIVLDPKDALALAEILSRAELYKSQYQRNPETNTSEYLHFVWEQEADKSLRMNTLSADLYAVAKMAGKPE